jgi:hypothetical protein
MGRPSREPTPRADTYLYMAKLQPESPAPSPLPGNGITSTELEAGAVAPDAEGADPGHGQGGAWPEGLEPDLRAALEDYIESRG